MVFNEHKKIHVTPLFISLHWLPVAARIKFKTLMLALVVYRTATRAMHRQPSFVYSKGKLVSSCLISKSSIIFLYKFSFWTLFCFALSSVSLLNFQIWWGFYMDIMILYSVYFTLIIFMEFTQNNISWQKDYHQMSCCFQPVVPCFLLIHYNDVWDLL